MKKLKTLDKLFDNVIIMVHLFHIIQNIIIQISTIAIFDKKPEFIIHQMTRRKFAFQDALNMNLVRTLFQDILRVALPANQVNNNLN